MRSKLKKIALVLFIASFIMISFSIAEEEKRGPVTHGELAKILADRMDLDVPENAPTQEYFATLEKRGIKPSEGWSQDKPVNSQDLEKILVEAGRFQAEVLSGKDAGSILKDRGIILPDNINKKTMNDVLKDQNVNRLLATPAVSGPSVPFPKEGVKILENRPELDNRPELIIPSLEIPLDTEPPTEPPATTEEPPSTLPIEPLPTVPTEPPSPSS